MVRHETVSSCGVAELVAPSNDLDADMDFFVARLAFRVAAVFPADDPRVAVVVGHGLRLRLEMDFNGPPAVIRLALSAGDPLLDAGELTAPNGTRVLLVDADPPLTLPQNRPSLTVTRFADGATWHPGRAGMLYRDLIPDRWGGRFIASHIRIPNGGPVPDYVHYHKVRFQMIFCVKGWVRVVYEDQGQPFLLHAGDCLLQPPRIRHRVLECSNELEVVEIGCPAQHETLADLDMELPNDVVDPGRDFDRQRFVVGRSDAAWEAFTAPGFEARDTGIGQATAGLVEVRVVRSCGIDSSLDLGRDGEFRFRFVLGGSAVLTADSRRIDLQTGDAAALPPGVDCLLIADPYFDFLQVTM